jgi:hypothetical protein
MYITRHFTNMKPETFNFALDKSGRTIDADGRLHVAKSHITKAAINPYYGKEIPNHDELGLEPDKIYQLFRDPEELKKAASTFARLPILRKHIPVTVDDPQPDLVIGAVGSDVSFNAPYVDADLVIWDAEAIAGIETKDVQELSCGYRYVPVMTAGEYQGKHYDGIMTEIRGNHVALVEVGRAGSDIVVGDENPFKTGKTMKKRDKIKKVLLAQDADIPVAVLDKILDDIIGVKDDAVEDTEHNPDPTEPNIGAVGDGSPADKIRELLAGKVEADIIEQICALATPEVSEDECPDKQAEDEDDKDTPPMKKEEVKAAMDAAINAGIAKERANMKAANKARLDVRAVVGDVLAIDSAEEIYSFALDQMGVSHKGVKEPAALKAIFDAANMAQTGKPAVIAQDSAAAKQFPDLNRFQRG